MELIYFHIGFHKTGSTWLQRELFSDKSYFNLLNNFFEPWKDDLTSYLVKCNLSTFDPIYFNKLVLERIKKDRINIISAERISGHPISGGFDADSISKKIYQSFPNAKIIIVSRDYNSFKNSTYKQVVKEGYPGKFQDFNGMMSWKKSGPSDFYFNQSNIIEIYKKTFDNVLELDFRQFQKDKEGFINSISTFFKKKIELNYNTLIINKTYSNKRIRAIRFLNKFRKTEYNEFPLITLSKKKINRLSIFFSFCFSKTKFDNDEFL